MIDATDNNIEEIIYHRPESEMPKPDVAVFPVLPFDARGFFSAVILAGMLEGNYGPDVDGAVELAEQLIEKLEEDGE